MADETTNTKIELIATGTEVGTWGVTTNRNWEILERIVRTYPVDFSNDTDYTVDYTYNGWSALMFVITTTGWTQSRTFNLPSSVDRLHIVQNAGDYTVTVAAGGGTTYDVPVGYTAIIRTGSTNAVNALGNLVVDGVSGTAVQITPAGGNATLDCSAGNYHYATITGAVTWTFSNPPDSGSAYRFQLELTDGGSGSQTWPASVDWPGGTGPTLQASGVDIIEFVTRDGGTTYYGHLQMANMS